MIERFTKRFPSPHSGILFLSDRKYLINDMWDPLGFRPLIRGFFFYNTQKKHCFPHCTSFRPLIRGFFFYSYYFNDNQSKILYGFRPLIRGFFFYHSTAEAYVKDGETRFRPLIRGFFFYIAALINLLRQPFFPSPHSGILFLFEKKGCVMNGVKQTFRPLIRGFFFYCCRFLSRTTTQSSFRPLIRGFFFYSCGDFGERYTVNVFPSPHSGILFLYAYVTDDAMVRGDLSVPSFGDSFFIRRGRRRTLIPLYFPSPHSGILFLSFSEIQTPSRKGAFRPLIRGFFFYEITDNAYMYIGEIGLSVPSFGDSFFITANLSHRVKFFMKYFPSPHSGILFL